MEKSSDEKRNFLGTLYSEHFGFIEQFRRELKPELDPEAIKKEGKFKNSENRTNDYELFKDESIEKAVILTFQNSQDKKKTDNS